VSFYSALSLAPILVIAIAVAGAVWDTAAAQARVVEHATDLVGPRGAEVVRAVLASATEGHSGLATVTSIAVVAVGATAVFAELESALNTIWSVEVPPGKGVRAFVRRRLVSAVFVVAVTGLLVASLAVSAGIAIVRTRIHQGTGVAAIPWEWAHLPVSLGALTLVFAACFKLLPATKISWREVWVGGATTSGLFFIGRELIGYYMARASLDSSYGAAGSLVVLLLWVYYSSVIFFIGAELTHVLTQRRRARDASLGIAAETPAE
jgi:membrane protein